MLLVITVRILLWPVICLFYPFLFTLLSYSSQMMNTFTSAIIFYFFFAIIFLMNTFLFLDIPSCFFFFKFCNLILSLFPQFSICFSFCIYGRKSCFLLLVLIDHKLFHNIKHWNTEKLNGIHLIKSKSLSTGLFNCNGKGWKSRFS